ncbi:hypothetical protein [Metamycoplasma hominis]|uniref:hypothetical protein n=1 Tax=Metamycoplasma hominis TaxID=2098 RepID=UPI001CD08ED4|nr:hypothetical protein [Metamycoplasma hominis]
MRVFIFIIERLNYYGKTIKRRWMISIFFWYKQYLNHDISKDFHHINIVKLVMEGNWITN